MVELLDLREIHVHNRGWLCLGGGDHPGQAMNGLGPEHQIHIGGPLADALALLLRHAAPHADEGSRAGFLDGAPSAELGEHLLLGLLPHRAGVEQEDVGLFRPLGDLHAQSLAQQIHHSGGVVLVHLAAEGTDVQLSGHDPCMELPRIIDYRPPAGSGQGRADRLPERRFRPRGYLPKKLG